MQRRTLLQMVLGSVAAYLTPLAALVKKQPPPLRADVKYPYPYGGVLLEVVGPPEQLVQFYKEYWDSLWPPATSMSRYMERARFLEPAYGHVRRAAQQSGRICVTLRSGYTIDSTKPSRITKAVEAAVLVTGCVLTEEAVQLMQAYGVDIQRLPACTEELS